MELGRTIVLCAASVEDRVPQHRRGTGSGWVTGEYSLLPRSTSVRTPREISSGRPAGRTQEIQRLIGRSLRAVTDLKALGERTIWVDCDVLQADGGTRTAAITGAFIALHDACSKLVGAGTIERSPIKDFIAAVSVGFVGEQAMLDLCYEEDVRAEVDMNIVMTGEGKLVEVQGTAEGEPFDRDGLNDLLGLGETGIRALVAMQRGILA